MIREIQAKTLLAHVKQPDTWFGLRYNLNLYRGCQHQCIYCDSRSECYQIENFHDVLVKVNALDLLRDELPRKREKGTIGFGSMSDPYTFAEKQYNLTGQALAVIAEHKFPVHLITKSDMVVKDRETLAAINEVFATVSFTITTTDDDLARQIEPGAPSPSRRLKAMAALRERGIHAGITLMPVLPFIEDNAANITQIVTQAADHGAEYILASFGMTLRDRQRAYYYDQLDRHFPGVRAQYERRFGNHYSCAALRSDQLWELFKDLCERYSLSTQVSRYIPPVQPTQLALL
ncbi:MAG: radical SAM protein [Anaerolineae bacterium]|nr:radical SAM protein [Anaerolineae bacterium]